MGVSDRELAIRAIDIEFQREVLDKLVRLETKMDALVGNGQPGRMKMAEDKVAGVGGNEMRKKGPNPLGNGGVSAAISAALAPPKNWLERKIHFYNTSFERQKAEK